MEPVSVGVIAAALIAKAIERAEGKALDGGEGVLRRLVEAVRGRFAGAHDEAGGAALDGLEETPDSPSRIRELAGHIDAAAESSPEFQEALASLIEEARSSGVDVEGVSQVVVGSQNVQAAELHQSEVNVSFGAGSRSKRGEQ